MNTEKLDKQLLKKLKELRIQINAIHIKVDIDEVLNVLPDFQCQL